MPHLTCVGHTRADIAELLDHYADNGVENILALGGDPPADGSDPCGDYDYASQLVEQVREHRGGFSEAVRSEEHTSELQSLLRNSYAVFCLNKNKHLIQSNGFNTTHQQYH